MVIIIMKGKSNENVMKILKKIKKILFTMFLRLLNIVV